MILSSFGFLLGILFTSQLHFLPSNFPVISAFCLSIVLLLYCRRQSCRHEFFVISIVIVCFMLGFAWAVIRANDTLSWSLPASWEKSDIQVEGVVLNLPNVTTHATKFLFQIQSLNYLSEHSHPNAVVQLKWYQDVPLIKPGQRWRLTVRLRQPRGLSNPGSFDYASYLFQAGIRATGYVNTRHAFELLDENATVASTESFRFLWNQTLSSLLDGRQFAGLIKALALGYRYEMTAMQWQVLQKTGTSHLMAISGLHVGMIAAFSLILFQMLFAVVLGQSRRYSPRQMAALFTMFVVWGYSLAAGFSVPTQRAAVMISVLLLCSLSKRHLSKSWALGIALWVVLLLAPFSVLSVSFWLSFTAVIVIFLILAVCEKQTSKLKTFFAVHVGLTLGLMPMTALYFQQVSLVTPLANFVAVPVVSFILLPLIWLGSLLAWLNPPLADIAFNLAEWVCDYLWRYLSYLAQWSWSSLAVSQWMSYGLAFMVLMVVIYFVSIKTQYKYILSGILVFVFCGFGYSFHDSAVYKMSVLDVGQGLAIVVQTKNHVMVYDAGAALGPSYNMGNRVVVPFLRHQGIRQIDKLVISHGDNDHLGGAEAIHDMMKVNDVISGNPDMISWRSASHCRAGMKWIWDAVHFEVLHPSKRYKVRNNNSCVIQISVGNKRFLLTGDIEATVERELVASAGQQLQADVLVVAHHGSKTSSTTEFLSKVQPAFAIVSAGYKNRYRQPHSSVIERFKSLSTQIINTAEAGAIMMKMLRFDSDIFVTNYRDQHRRFW